MTEIIPNLKIVDLALYHTKEDILIIGDTHIGYEEALNKQGLFIPRFQFEEIGKRLDNILKKTKKLKKIIINGDIKHEFGTISEQEWRHTLRLLDFLSKYCKDIILIRGNHDTILGPIAKKRNVKIEDSYIIHERSELGKKKFMKQISSQRKNNILIIHGHKIPKQIPKETKTIIIGHEHPAISLREGPRVETYKCFLKGKWKRYNLIVMPSFNLITEGTDIVKERLLSPFLQQNIESFEAYIIADKIYKFGKLKNLNF